MLLVGRPGSGKTCLLRRVAHDRGVRPLNVGASLGARLAPLSRRQRQLSVARFLTELASAQVVSDILMLDNLELLFDQALKVSPLEILKQQAHARRVLAVWPGELRDERLRYAETGHPEYRDYAHAEGSRASRT